MPTTITAKKLPSAEAWHWVTAAWVLFKQSVGIFIGIFLITMLVTAVARSIPMLGDIISSLLMPVFAGGLIYTCKQLDRHAKIEFEMIFQGFRENLSELITLGAIYLGLLFAAFIPAAIILIISTGSADVFIELMNSSDYSDLANAETAMAALLGFLIFMLLACPVFMAYYFAPALIMDKGMKAWPAMKLSFSACLMNILPLTWFSLIIFALAIIAAIPLFLGYIVLIPVLMITSYTSYSSIFEVENHHENSLPDTPSEEDIFSA